MSFDRPVVPLMPAEDANGQPAPFTITPALKVPGHWSDTATYVFTPAAPMVGGVKYTVTVPARFKAVDGSALAQPYVSTFVTMYPEVTEIAASGNDLVDCSDRYLVGLGCSVTVSFSEAVDSASALAAFSLTEKGTGKVIQGKATLSADGKKLTFKPAARFAYNTTYEATVLNSTLNRARTATIARTETVDLDTIFGPSIENIDDNSSTSDTGIVQFDFNSPMISATVKSRIVISPTPKDLN